MYRDPRFSGIFQTLGGPAAKPPTLLQKVVGAVVMAGVFMLALTFSVAFFAVLLTAGVAIWGWVWWKTRALRKAMRAQMDAQAAAGGARAGGYGPAAGDRGLIIEGEVIREVEIEEDPRRDGPGGRTPS
ncbi:hypothetical protein [Thauera aminoaromatica]|uniref:Uncharacterized protein n=1 Tax=Thauera aminoaromatica TaxID=164330 RepID=A0A5C7S1S8_THASP|nr:hypothetical protein [Thauera aminoaromatica]TXH77500.1 MAG: hypothetical protein E6Q80_24600 [Thauera aminoaromatica]